MPLNSTAAPAGRGQCQAIDLIQKIDSIDGHWQPRVVAEMNDYQFKVVKVQGEFPWHVHAETDETFVVLEGELRIAHRASTGGEGVIVLRAGQMAVVPKGIEHKPSAIAEVKMLLIEPRGVVNTGDGAPGARTVENDQWI
ncbi:cupin domain-containing protein [Acidovorax radicis]|uniref:cupin domain-containing protein n=1 Tax=Acidovorax radicis TaxID=758826 RepID=UPI001CF9FEFE|nr:cupin domain-containing protein [Acidovorax radicis]UCV01571.1 cupin domain-containing protein [Acidovorax radicis]